MKKKKLTDSHIERRIVTGLILKTEFCEKIKDILKVRWLKNKESRRIAGWCISYYTKYNKAPKQEVENIYYDKVDSLNADEAGLIEETLFSLNEEYKRTKKFNVDYLLDISEKYIQKRQLQDLIDNAQEELDSGELLQAKNITSNFKPVERVQSNAVIPLGSVDSIKDSFDNQFNPLFTYGETPLGDMLNRELCRGCFVSILAKMKGGKSFTLMDMGMRAVRSGCNVMYIQAGDMSRKQQERRQGIYLAQKSDLEEYCKTMYIPVLDCCYNQNGTCDKKYRASKINPFEGYTAGQLRGEKGEGIENVKYKDIIDRVKEFKKYKRCIVCAKSTNPSKYNQFKGTVWYRRRNKVEPLGWKELYHLVNKKFKKQLSRMRLISYPTKTLTVSMIKQEWDILEKTGFIPDICIVDYMDILAPDIDTKSMSPRDQENEKWARMRSLALQKNALVIQATQADAKSFKKKLLDETNFSEDKRKLDHVTFMLGLNMNPLEKIKGVARYNSVLSRENSSTRVVNVLHRLEIGRPILGSFY